MPVAGASTSSAIGVVHMNEAKKPADNAKDPEEEFIEALTEEALERLVVKGTLVPFTDGDGSTKYRISSKSTRASTASSQRPD
jgi:hypothetical protein